MQGQEMAASVCAFCIQKACQIGVQRAAFSGSRVLGKLSGRKQGASTSHLPPFEFMLQTT